MGVIYRAGTYNFSKSTDGVNWQVVSESEYNRGHTLSYLQGKLYLIKGDGDGSGNETYCRSSSNEGATWSAVGLIDGVALQRHKSVVFNDKIYVLGGNKGKLVQKLAHSLNTASTKLSTLGTHQAITNYYNHGSCVHNNAIWVFGGETDTTDIGLSFNNIFRSYDGVNWDEVIPIGNIKPNRRTLPSVASFNGELVVIGGYSDKSLKTINTKVKTAVASRDGRVWRAVTPPPVIESSIANNVQFDGNNNLVVLDDKLFYFSSHKPSSTSGYDEPYTTAYYTTDLVTWTQVNTNLDGGNFLPAFTSVNELVLPLNEIKIDINSYSTNVIEIDPVSECLVSRINLVSQSLMNISFSIGTINIGKCEINSASSVACIPKMDDCIGTKSLKGQLLYNNVAVPNAKAYIISDTTNQLITLRTDSNGNFETSVNSNEYYHVVCVWKNDYGELFSTVVEPYVSIGGG